MLGMTRCDLQVSSVKVPSIHLLAVQGEDQLSLPLVRLDYTPKIAPAARSLSHSKQDLRSLATNTSRHGNWPFVVDLIWLFDGPNKTTTPRYLRAIGY